MATILKNVNREFKENPGRIDNFRLFSDMSRVKSGIDSKNLNFDLRLLNPGQFSAPYHFHRNAEELFMVVSGSMTLRTPKGLELLNAGDLVFFEMGETGAHQVYNHSSEPCTYLDIRTFFHTDICEYPDSGKTLVIPSMQVFEKESKVSYFKGEENIVEKWNTLKSNKKSTFDFSINREEKTIAVKREFASELSIVWDAYTKCEILDQWWAPKPWKARTKSMNFTEGGRWLYAMVGPLGEEHWSLATYKDIQYQRKFRGIDAFTDAEGNVNSEMPVSQWTVTFAEKGQETLVEFLISYDDLAQLDATIQMGFEVGLGLAMEGLDEILISK